jgi:hypothetical protein
MVGNAASEEPTNTRIGVLAAVINVAGLDKGVDVSLDPIEPVRLAALFRNRPRSHASALASLD